MEDRCCLAQNAAGEIMSIDQPKVSQLMTGRTGKSSVERLMKMLNAFGRDVTITTTASREPQGRIHVVAAAKAVARRAAGPVTDEKLAEFPDAGERAGLHLASPPCASSLTRRCLGERGNCPNPRRR
jgi:hypothetical protein